MMTRHDPNALRRLLLPTLAAGALLLSACGDDDTSDTATAQDVGSADTDADVDDVDASGVTSVDIVDFTYMPADFTVAPGAEITFVNLDSTQHTATASDGSFNTGTIEADAGGTATAPSEPGEYPYICSFHPFMKGTLTVE
jgi:plastocyanin